MSRMSSFSRFIDALHETRRREAERIVNRYQRLVEESCDYECHRAKASGAKAAGVGSVRQRGADEQPVRSA